MFANGHLHKASRMVTFVCHAPEAGSVSLVGDFNHWNPSSHRMRQTLDHSWMLTVEMAHGYHRYAFLVDGELKLDPLAQGITEGELGERVSLTPVG